MVPNILSCLRPMGLEEVVLVFVSMFVLSCVVRRDYIRSMLRYIWLGAEMVGGETHRNALACIARHHSIPDCAPLTSKVNLRFEGCSFLTLVR